MGQPAEERYCWVKGRPAFDTLRQACIDPDNRAYVGPEPPPSGAPSQSISRITVSDAPWLTTTEIGLNPGLVAIIGPRGSGKTALADIIAAGCDAIHESDERGFRPSASFIQRARDLLGTARVETAWRGGDSVVRALDGSDTPMPSTARARYLSQSFVEELCSSTGMTDELVREIERVIFEAHPVAERDGTLDFHELLEKRATRYRTQRHREEEAIVTLSERIGLELEKDREKAALKQKVDAAEKKIAQFTKDRAKLVAKGSEKRAEQLAEVVAAAEAVQNVIRGHSDQVQSLLSLQDEVRDLRENKAPEMLRVSQERHIESKLKAEDWQAFLVDYKGDVDAQLRALLEKANKLLSSKRGTTPSAPEQEGGSFIPAGSKLQDLPLAVLTAEVQRLEKLVNADSLAQRRFATLSRSIAAETAARRSLQDKHADAAGAKARARQLQDERDAAYKRVFEAIEAEEGVLTSLYEPLMVRLRAAEGTLSRLSFSIGRVVDVAGWAARAENELVDLRRQGPFRGRGSLSALTDDTLRPAWEAGDAGTVASALAKFRDDYHEELLAHSIVPKGDADYRAWLKRFAKWLFSTDHISLRYAVGYNGVDLGKLSPGTRGIVLLLLYLALDDQDARPLIIDQPEENLDPKSVFDELVGLFEDARANRQVIMVTHNANLVVNTDADQVIVAEAAPRGGGLPTISYSSGGLEEAGIRRLVCDTLEGGEEAFRARSRRLRITLRPDRGSAAKEEGGSSEESSEAAAEGAGPPGADAT